MKVSIIIIIALAIMCGWNEVENTNGHAVKNFLRGAWTGVLFGIIVSMLVWLILWSIGIY